MKYLHGFIIVLMVCIVSMLTWSFHFDQGVHNKIVNDNYEKQIQLVRNLKPENKGQSDALHDVEVSTQKNEVLLFGYLRGGTTFLGDLLGQRTDTFYHSEPLNTFVEYGYFSINGRCSIRNVYCRFESADKVIRHLQRVYNCSHTHVHPNTVSWYSFRHFGEWHNALFKDYRKSRNSSYLKFLDSKCMNSSNIVTKVARITMDLTPIILSSRPNLKIVHLIRDPRAIIRSRIYAFNAINITEWSKSLCHKMEEDYKQALELSALFPKRISILIYEDFVTRPDALLGPLHKFAGLSFSEEDETRILKLMLPTSNTKDFNRKDRWDVFRPKGSRYTALYWRKILPFRVVKIIERECATTMRLLNYTLFINETTLRDFDIHAFTGKSLFL